MAALDEIDQKISQAESGGSAEARNPESTASGKYGFIRKTFEGVQKNNPSLPRVTWEEFQKSPELQDQYQTALRAENDAVLTRNKLDVTPTNAYMVHFFGAPKGVSLLKANEADPITDHLSPEIIKKNKLDPAMTVGDLRTQVGNKMGEATGQPYRVQIVGYNTGEPEEVPNAGQGIRPASNPFGADIAKRHEEQMAALEKSLAKVRQYPEGSREFNMAVADEYKKGFGPNWTNAFLAALFGQKEQALTWITGGKINKPQIAEAYVGGQLKRVQINSNERGDQWFTDASTGARLPDNLQITSTSPESAIQTSRVAEQVKSGTTPQLGIGQRSLETGRRFQETEGKVSSWTDVLPTNYAMLESIQDGTRTFKEALDNPTQGPEGRTIMSTIKAFLSGAVDENKLRDAALFAKVPPSEMGRFVQFVRDMKTISQNDARFKDAHAPGSGSSGEISLEGGTQGLRQWLHRRIGDQATQDAYNSFFLKNKQDPSMSTIVDVNDAFSRSAERQAILNMQKRKTEGRNAKIPDGAPIADFDANGRFVMRKYNAKTQRGE